MTYQDYYWHRKTLYERLKKAVETGNFRQAKQIAEQIECQAEEYGRDNILQGFAQRA